MDPFLLAHRPGQDQMLDFNVVALGGPMLRQHFRRQAPMTMLRCGL
jgi:hypothetical protein